MCPGAMSMALPEDEQRRLAEIEAGLAEDDPRLARRLGSGQAVTVGSLAALIVGAILMLGAGVIIIVSGARLGAPLVIAIGVLIAVIVPATVWLVRRR